MQNARCEHMMQSIKERFRTRQFLYKAPTARMGASSSCTNPFRRRHLSKRFQHGSISGALSLSFKPEIETQTLPRHSGPPLRVGSCQSSGPFLGTLITRCRFFLGAQKGTTQFSQAPECVVTPESEVSGSCEVRFPKGSFKGPNRYLGLG